MSRLEIEDLNARVGNKDILRGVNLVIEGGEVHALMGPNGSGKSTLSHVLMGKPGYEVTGGSVRLDDVELLGLPTWQRAQAGLFLGMQYPTEIEGVGLDDVLAAAADAAGNDVDAVLARMRDQAHELGITELHMERGLNVDMSGGEKKRNETLQLAALRPKIAILDELDSGLDVDGLRAVSRLVERATNDHGLGVLAITHYSRLLRELVPDVVHVFADGAIQETGGPDLAVELEETGYDRWLQPIESAVSFPGF
jgi:Fe-S cluster assembly ATP-binding protein